MNDIRKYSKTTTTRLVLGVILIILFIGTGLIYLIYGPAAAGLGLTCLLGAGIPIALIFIFLTILERVVKKNRAE